MADSVLITGASSGLGLDMSVRLAEKGFRVYATMKDPQRRGALDAEAERRNVDVTVLPLDVRDERSIQEAVDYVVADSGGIYGLVNNAGISMRGFFEDVSREEIQEVFQTNVLGVMAVTRAALPHMRAAGRGRVIINSSIGGRIGSLGTSTYCATKFAVEGFGESLSQEVSPFGVYVSLIEPGLIHTPIFTYNRRTAEGAHNPSSPYYQWFLREEQLVDRVADSSGIKEEHVTRAVHKALTAKRPRLRYVVGRRAR
ncbi:MAG: SDR family oxidoreductase, partial [Chloroflexota bacterium]